MMDEVVLRNVVQADLPVFFEHQMDPEATQMAAFPSRNRDDFMAHWAKILENEKALNKTILFRDQVVGNIASFEQAGERQVGYWIGREFWGQGVATQALSKFLQLEKQRPLTAWVVKHNLGSQRVLQKCGFVLVGEEEEDFIYKLDA